MTVTPQTEHTCNAYCAGGHHAEVYWTNQDDDHIESTARTFMSRHGLHLIRWQPAPEARWAAGEEFIQWDPASRGYRVGKHNPRDRAVLLVWEEAARQLPLAPA